MIDFVMPNGVGCPVCCKQLHCKKCECAIYKNYFQLINSLSLYAEEQPEYSISPFVFFTDTKQHIWNNMRM